MLKRLLTVSVCGQVLGRPRIAFTTSKAATFPSTQSLEDLLTTTQDHSSAKHSTEVSGLLCNCADPLNESARF